MLTAQHCNQNAPSAELSSTYKDPSVDVFDYDGDIDMGHMESGVVGSSPGTSFAVSPSDSPAIKPKSMEWINGQRQEICFGMVRSISWPSQGCGFLTASLAL